MDQLLHRLGQVGGFVDRAAMVPVNAYALLEAAHHGILPGTLQLQRQLLESQIARSGPEAEMAKREMEFLNTADPATVNFIMRRHFKYPLSLGESLGYMNPAGGGVIPATGAEAAGGGASGMPTSAGQPSNLPGVGSGVIARPGAPGYGNIGDIIRSMAGEGARGRWDPNTGMSVEFGYPPRSTLVPPGTTDTGETIGGSHILQTPAEMKGFPAGTTGSVDAQGRPQALQPGLHGKTNVVLSPQPGQMVAAQGGATMLDTINDLQRMMKDPKYASAVAKLGPALGSSGAANAGVPSEYGVQSRGGGKPVLGRIGTAIGIGSPALTPEEYEFANKINLLNGMAPISLAGSGAGRLKSVVDKFQIHVPDIDRDDPASLQSKLNTLQKRFSNQLARIPATPNIFANLDPNDPATKQMIEQVFGDYREGAQPGETAPRRLQSATPATGRTVAPAPEDERTKLRRSLGLPVRPY